MTVPVMHGSFSGATSSSVDDSKLPIASTTDPDKILKSDEFAVFENVPVFVEHRRELKSGRVLQFGRDELQKVADRSNRRIAETGDFSPIVIGHTSSDNPSVKPPKIGWAGPFKLGWLSDKRDTYAILCDFRIEKDKVGMLKEYPRRSAEIWAEEDYADMYLDPISLLGADTPWSDMGVLYAKKDDPSLKKVYYSIAPQAPSGYNVGGGLPAPTAVKPSKKKELYSMDNNPDYNRLTPDQQAMVQVIINAIFNAPEFDKVRRDMQAEGETSAGVDTGDAGTVDSASPTAVTPESGALPVAEPIESVGPLSEPVGEGEEPADDAQSAQEPVTEDPEEKERYDMGSGSDASGGLGDPLSEQYDKPEEEDEPLDEGGSDDDSFTLDDETGYGEDEGLAGIGELSEADKLSLLGDEDEEADNYGISDEDELDFGAGVGPLEEDDDDYDEDFDEDFDEDDLDGLVDEGDEDGMGDDIGPDEYEEEDYFDGEGDDAGLDDALDDDETLEEGEEDMGKLDAILKQLASLKEDVTALKKGYDWSADQLVSQARYAKIDDLRQYRVFDAADLKKRCRYNKMSDKQFAAELESIRANNRPVPTGIGLPPGLVANAPEYDAVRPGAVQYSKEQGANLEAKVRQLSDMYAMKGQYKCAEEIRQEAAEALGIHG